MKKSCQIWSKFWKKWFFAYLCIFMVEWLVTHVETLSVHICYFAPLKNSFLGTCSCSALCLFSKTLTRSIFFARHTHTHCHFSSKFEMKWTRKPVGLQNWIFILTLNIFHSKEFYRVTSMGTNSYFLDINADHLITAVGTYQEVTYQFSAQSDQSQPISRPPKFWPRSTGGWKLEVAFSSWN